MNIIAAGACSKVRNPRAFIHSRDYNAHFVHNRPYMLYNFKTLYISTNAPNYSL